MFTLLPQLLFLTPLSATLIRVAAAIGFGYVAWKHLGQTETTLRTAAIIEGMCAILLLVGATTQIAAIAGFVILLVHGYLPKLRVLPTSSILLLSVLCLSLVATGAGAFSFDLPL